MSRLSLNQKTTDRLSLPEAARVCADAGLEWIGLWREPVADHGLDATAATVTESGLGVSSLCRGGFWPAETSDGFEDNVRDNVEAIDEAAALGTDVLVLVCGGIAGGDLDRSRSQVAEGIARVVPHARDRGVRLAIEPLHPMFAADRSVVVTMSQALDMAEAHNPDEVGVVVDTYHVWWDPDVWNQIERAGERIFSYQVCDWLDPLPDLLMGRGMMGDGVIEFKRFSEAVAEVGYEGPIEVEIFNQDVWDRDPSTVVAEMIERYEELVEI